MDGVVIITIVNSTIIIIFPPSKKAEREILPVERSTGQEVGEEMGSIYV